MDFIDVYIAAGTYFQGLSVFIIVDYSRAATNDYFDNRLVGWLLFWLID